MLRLQRRLPTVVVLGRSAADDPRIACRMRRFTRLEDRRPHRGSSRPDACQKPSASQRGRSRQRQVDGGGAGLAGAERPCRTGRRGAGWAGSSARSLLAVAVRASASAVRRLVGASGLPAGAGSRGRAASGRAGGLGGETSSRPGPRRRPPSAGQGLGRCPPAAAERCSRRGYRASRWRTRPTVPEPVYPAPAGPTRPATL